MAAEWLQRQGFRIIERNWRTRWCELDIIAQCDGVIHIVEVRYRRSSVYGSGLESVTAQKAQRLQRAALMWLSRHHFDSYRCQIDIISVSGFPKPKEIMYVPNAILAN